MIDHMQFNFSAMDVASVFFFLLFVSLKIVTLIDVELKRYTLCYIITRLAYLACLAIITCVKIKQQQKKMCNTKVKFIRLIVTLIKRKGIIISLQKIYTFLINF